MFFILIGSDLSIVNYILHGRWHSGYCFAVATKKKGGDSKKRGGGGGSLERCLQAINQIQLIRSADKISQVGLLLTDWARIPQR